MTGDDKTSVDETAVTRILQEHWGSEARLNKLVKASQNFTFEASIPQQGTTATTSDGDAHLITCIARVTPRIDELPRIQEEMDFLSWLNREEGTADLHAMGPIATRSKNANEGTSLLAHDGCLIVVVFHYAPGVSPYPENRWLKDGDLIRAWGAWFARFHREAQRYAQTFPERYQAMRSWEALHDDCMRGHPVDKEDAEMVNDPQRFGILHGDLNCSNFYVVGTGQDVSMYVFDWDQIQRGWFMYDVAQAAWGCFMMAGAGSYPSKEPVPDASPERTVNWLVEGYESVSGKGSVDRTHLQRMISLRRDFYEVFCRRALVRKDMPDGMMHFVQYVVDWFDDMKRAKGTSILEK